MLETCALITKMLLENKGCMKTQIVVVYIYIYVYIYV
jgi:hypothetical protein